MTTRLGDQAEQAQLAGQVALVTGGGRGFGRVFAEGLARAGAAVAVLARSKDEITETARRIEVSGGRAMAVVADVTDRRAIERAVVDVEQQLGPLDLLINNAGVDDTVGPAWDVDPERWWRELDINLRGPFLCAHAVLQRMTPRGQGRVINVASLGGTVGRPYRSAYACSKAALIRLTECLAEETRRQALGISAFAIHPGIVMTPMNEGHLTNPDIARWFPEWRGWLEALRGKSPEPAMRLVLFLASGRADALSGRFFDAEADNLEDLVQHAEDIVREDRRVLRLRS